MQSADDIVNRIAHDVGMLRDDLLRIIRTAPIRYKVFYLEKRRDGLREVAQPAREVKLIQRWFMKELSPLLPIHDAATAYRPGGSISDNAARHRNSNYLLKLDFTNFFPSIQATDIERHLDLHCGAAYDTTATKLIAYVCSWAPKRQRPLRLCIGAPSSPMLSNSVMFAFDCLVAEVASRENITYSRYADDLAFSSCRFGALEKLIPTVKEIVSKLDYPRLEINESKTVLASRAGLRIVAGITLTPDHHLSVGRDRKRLIRAMYHRQMLGSLTAEESQKLGGLIAFVESIEPGFSQRLKKTKASGGTG